MPRPCKQRRVCMEPTCHRFGPKGIKTCGEGQRVPMTLDEFETVRLIDLEGMTQEACAVQMQVARTTVQAIYESARSKIAQCLVNGKELDIDGGDVVVCDGTMRGCAGKKQCPRRCCRDIDNSEV
jgi:uncharacterized protein